MMMHCDDDDDVYYYIRWRLKLEGETENIGVCTKERKGDTAEVLMATLITLPALIHWEVKVGGRSMKDVGGAVLAGSALPFLGRERAAVDVDVGPERRSPRYHETCLALVPVPVCLLSTSQPIGIEAERAGP